MDTSAIAKRYVVETGTNWVQAITDPQAGNSIIISELCLVELISLMARRVREGSITQSDLINIQNDFLIHAKQQYRVINLGRRIITDARKLVTQYPLRSLDAIQLASARSATKTLNLPPTFVSADNKLLLVATTANFLADNPNLHP